MDLRRVGAVVVLSALLASVILFVGAPPARAQVGPKNITVDGNPGDWIGVLPATPNTGVVSNGEAVWNDTAGDDTGDGDYTYPKGPLNITGLFDIREGRITANATHMFLLLRVGNLTNVFGGSEGFSVLGGVLLIDTTRDASGRTTARPNVNITAGKGWEYWVKLGQTGWHPDNAKVFDTAGRWAPIENRGDETTEVIEAAIPLSFIGKDGTAVNGATWRFMFLLGGFAGERPNGFREVRGARWCCDWEFGGGDDGPYDPEVTDIAFSATQATQEAELGSYVPLTNTSATITSSIDVVLGTLGFTPDTTAPAIGAVTVTPTFNSAKIDWTTSELANTTLRWGTAPGSLTNTVFVDEFVTSHTVTLTNLQALTAYYYRIEAWDFAGNRATSAEAVFNTAAEPPSNIAAFVGSTFTWNDRLGDDVGDGDYKYPTNTADVKWSGRADLSWVNMTRTSTALHINAKLNTAPETEWRQRMGTIAIFIDQDNRFDSGARYVGLVGTGAELTDPHPMNISVAPNFAWEYLVVANFQNRSAVGDASGIGEMFVFNNTWNPTQQRWTLIYLSTAPSLSPKPDTGQIYAKDGTEVDIWLNHSVFGTTDGWTFVIAGMLFDDAARAFDQGGIRQVRETAAAWIGGGSNGPGNPNVYDAAFYPDTASQIADLSNYTTGQWANLTRGVRINFGAGTFQLVRAVPPVPITHSYAVSVVPSSASLDANETATINVTFTDNAQPIAGAEVRLEFAPATAGTIVGNQIGTTNAQGQVAFTFRAGTVSADTTVTFSATAKNDTTNTTRTGSLTVKKPVTPPLPPAEGLSPVLIAGVVILIIIVIAALALLMRRKKAPGAGGEGPPKT